MVVFVRAPHSQDHLHGNLHLGSHGCYLDVATMAFAALGWLVEMLELFLVVELGELDEWPKLSHLVGEVLEVQFGTFLVLDLKMMDLLKDSESPNGGCPLPNFPSKSLAKVRF